MRTSMKVAAAVVGLAASLASAATFTWDGGSTVDSNWSSAANWTSDNRPPVGGASDAVIVMTSGNKTTNNQDQGNPFVLNSIGVTGAGTGFTINGSMLEFAGANASITTGGSRQMTINCPLNLTVNVTVKNNTGTITLGGEIGGSGGLGTSNYTGTLKLIGSKSNTFTGLTTVKSGTIDLGKTGGAIAVAGDVEVGDGTGTDTLKFSAANQIADTSDLVLKSGGVLNLNTYAQTLASLSSVSGASLFTGSGSNGVLTVDEFFHDGAKMSGGTYTSTNAPTGLTITGGGSLVVVPEPATLTLLGLGGVAAVVRRRRA